jgi:hypothetical protein
VARSKDVQLANVTESVEISLERGDIELRPGSLPLGKYDVRTRSGEIDFAIPEKAKLDLSVTTEKGEISNDYGDAFRAEETGRGATLKGSLGDGPRVVLSTNRGGITIRKSGGAQESRLYHEPDEAPKTPSPPAAPKRPAPPALKPVEQ